MGTEVSYSHDQMQQLLLAMQEQNRQLVLELAKAMREPDPDTKKKKEEEAARAEKNRAEYIDMVKAEEQSRINRQRACSHRKENGKFSTGGQIIGGRFAALWCSHCQKPWYKLFSPDVMAQLNSGDLILFGADPSGWDDVPPQVG